MIATAAIPTLTRIESLCLIALTFGFVVGLMIVMLGRLSGAVINPAVLIAALFSGALKKFSSFDTTNLGSTRLALGYRQMAGILIEAVGTFVLTNACLLAGKELRKDYHRRFSLARYFFLDSHNRTYYWGELQSRQKFKARNLFTTPYQLVRLFNLSINRRSCCRNYFSKL